MKRNELLKAKDEKRSPKTLLESDYLLQVSDFARQGARPKASVVDNKGSLFIAKFPSRHDEWNIPLWEYVCFKLAEDAGLSAPLTRLETIAGKKVLLLERFDRNKQQKRIPYISAMSMLGMQDGEHGSYLFIAESLKKYGAEAKTDCKELWKRIVFNILISNIDDHLRNHGFLYINQAGWRLSPVFDLEPTPHLYENKALHTAITSNSTRKHEVIYMQQDIRWKQRFSNFKKALVALEVGVKLYAASGLSELEKQGVIQGFEFTHELSWKVMQDFLREKGETSIYGSKDATHLAFNRGLISNGEGWMGMVKDRNLSSHTYQEEVAEKIFKNIVDIYFPLFKQFEAKMDELSLTD